jgi:hypothetical protein
LAADEQNLLADAPASAYPCRPHLKHLTSRFSRPLADRKQQVDDRQMVGSAGTVDEGLQVETAAAFSNNKKTRCYAGFEDRP